MSRDRAVRPGKSSVAQVPGLRFARRRVGNRLLVYRGRLSEHPSTSEYELMKRLGSAMTHRDGMSAFACELAMKGHTANPKGRGS